MLTMLRGPAVLICLIIVLLCVLGFGFNSYRSVNSRLRRSEEYSDKLKSQYDAMVAQARVLQEHKTRLEARLQTDAQHHKEELEDILSDRKKMGELLASEKTDLKNRIDSLTENGKRLESELEKVTDGLASAQAGEEECKESYQQLNVSASASLRHLKQVCSNEAALFMDKVANLERRIVQLQSSPRVVPSEKKLTAQAHQDIPDLSQLHDNNFQIPVPGEDQKPPVNSIRLPDHPLGVHESEFEENGFNAQENKDNRKLKLYPLGQSNLTVAESPPDGLKINKEEIEQNHMDQRETNIHQQHLQEQNSQQLANVLQVGQLPDNKIMQKERQSNAAVEEDEEQYQEEHH